MANNIDILAINPHKWNIFPFGMGTLLAILRKKNFKIEVLDAGNRELSVSQTVENIIKCNPKIIFFTGLLTKFSFIRDVSNLTREKFPKGKQIAGGWWSRTIPAIVLDETSVDVVVRNEPDLFIVDFCKKIMTNEDISNFPGVCYKKGQNYYLKDPCEPPSKLDLLPTPAYDLFNMNYYVWTVRVNQLNLSVLNRGPWHSPFFMKHPRYDHIKNKKALKWTAMYSGRGCYGKCTFCTAARMLRKNFSAKYVVDHMEKMQKEYHIDVFHFTESLTLSTKNWVKEFCQEILSRKIKCLYIVFSRSDIRYDDEMLSLLSKSGCHTVRIGFESGDNAMLVSMNKKTTMQKNREYIKSLHAHQIHVSGSFIFNMPGETQESINNTIEFIANTNIYDFDYGFATPYPDTTLYDYAISNGFIEEGKNYIVNELGTPRKMSGVFQTKDMGRYLRKFNFNNFTTKQLCDTRNKLEELRIINRAHFSSPLLHSVLVKIPHLTWFFKIRRHISLILPPSFKIAIRKALSS